MINSLIKDRDGNLSSRIILILANTILSWIIVFIYVIRNTNIQPSILTFLVTITTKTGVDSISQVYQNTKDNNNNNTNKKE